MRLKFGSMKKRLYICPMRKAILITTCFIGSLLHSQIKVENKQPTIFPNVIKKDGIYFYRPANFIKFSFKSSFNDGQVYDLLTQKQKTFKANDYLKVGGVDMRMKIYLMPHLQFVMGGNFSGLNEYSCNTGIIIKL